MKKQSKLIDTHSHLTFPEFEGDRDEVLRRAWEAGLEYIIVVGAGEGLAGNSKAIRLAGASERLFVTVGVHPHDAKDVSGDWIEEVKKLSSHEKVVAIGEIGLDYHHCHSEPKVQKEVFRKLLRLAREVNKPVAIHDREAHDDVWDLIMDEGVPERGGVFHCFSGDVNFAEKVVDAGFHISIPGVVTFKNAKELQEVVAVVPLEKMVIETDCPFLAPEPHRGKRNEPSYVAEIAERIAKIKGMTTDDVARVTTQNAKRLFSLPGADLIPQIAYQIRNSLYLNITNSCNLACRFCPKFTDFAVKGYYLKLDHEPDVEEVFQSVGQPEDYDEVVFCGYGEPTKRLEVLKVIAKRMKERGAKKIRLNTDGLANLLYGRNVLPELAGIIDSVSVSMNAADEDFYVKVCPSAHGKAAYKAACDFIVEAKKYIPEVVASIVAMPGLDVEACRKKARELGVTLRVRQFMNVG